MITPLFVKTNSLLLCGILIKNSNKSKTQTTAIPQRMIHNFSGKNDQKISVTNRAIDNAVLVTVPIIANLRSVIIVICSLRNSITNVQKTETFLI